jgi:deoxyribodipyrimidine photo-lyase
VTSIIWFRRDLRLGDNPAVAAACREQSHVVPFFCIDASLLEGRFASGPRTQFMLEALSDLNASLHALDSALIVRVGDPVTELIKLAGEVHADTVHACVDAGPYARRRDRAAGDQLEQAGIALKGAPGVFAIDSLQTVRTGAGSPFQVFTPFYRAWMAAPRREAIPAPTSLPRLPSHLRHGAVPTLGELGLSSDLSDPMPGGEGPGLARWQQFRDGGLGSYESGRNDLAADGSSKLSPYLHFGCLSPRQLEAEMPNGQGAEEFRRQLAWRDFYAQLLRDFPDNLRHEFQKRYRDKINWSQDEADFGRWQTGTTGYPLVDAGMRQLATEGWMHNRARLVVGSFLTKELGIDWRWGERHFMKLLLDGDVASNNGNWQWIASVGVDPQPITRRILSPARQQERFDPSGTYVRRYVPELANVPDAHIVEPWGMSEAEQRECGCVMGQVYPEPMVDRREARAAAIERFGAAAAAAH